MTWGTVTLADEPTELLLAFAAWHAHLGASEIHIFLDRPNKPTAQALRDIPGVIVSECDDMFWHANGGRGLIQTRRQDAVANLAYAETDTDWLIHMDADEFLIDSRDILAELLALPETILGLRVPVRERVWTMAPETVFEGSFKVPLPGKLGLDHHLYGELSRYMQRGLIGHTRGKTICRTGQDLVMSIHGPRDQDTMNLMEAQSLHLLHFDGLTPFHWLLKRLKYASLPHAEAKKNTDHYRWNQIGALQTMDTLDEARRFQEELTFLKPEFATKLRALGLLEDAPTFEIGAALRKYSLDDLDLSAARFDRRLRRRDREFVEEIGWGAED
ncbi:MAG: glycosyltransferase family 2 protein [Rhodobacteraceae bacterium]|nr:glycosyltransferase family 2 protein [Paracoccaceae bacterium]